MYIAPGSLGTVIDAACGRSREPARFEAEIARRAGWLAELGVELGAHIASVNPDLTLDETARVKDFVAPSAILDVEGADAAEGGWGS